MLNILRKRGLKYSGRYPLSVVAKTDGHLEAIEKSICMRMTRGIERTCKSANRQIQETSSKLQKIATGLLILLNEDVKELDPCLVARRIWDYTHSQRTNIHYCLLIFETHQVNINGTLRPYPLLLDLTYSARQRRASRAMRDLQLKWAMINGYPEGLPEQDPKAEDFLPNGTVFGG